LIPWKRRDGAVSPERVMATSETISINGHSVDVLMEARRYPGTIFKWGYWKFSDEPDNCYRSLGDPYSGRGAAKQIRHDVERQVRQTLHNPTLFARKSLIGAIVQYEGSKYMVKALDSMYLVMAVDINNGSIKSLPVSKLHVALQEKLLK